MLIPFNSTKARVYQKKFFAELIGTFVLVVLATGSVVLDSQFAGKLGPWFVALCPAVAVTLMILLFGKISMAHLNPAVTIGFFISRFTLAKEVPLYLFAEIVGAILGSFFVKNLIGIQPNLGANAPNYKYSLFLIFGIETLATALLMAVILIIVHKKLRISGAVAVGATVGLDIFFFSFISGASMNPARSLAPALLSGFVNDLWLYLTATFVGSGAIGFTYRKLAGFKKT